MGEVIHLSKRGLVSAPEMLRKIADSNPEHAFVIVWPEDGRQPTYHASTEDCAVVLMRVNEFIHKFYNDEFEFV